MVENFKSFKDIAVEKSLDLPNDSGLVFTKRIGMVSSTASSLEDLQPNDKEFEIINSLSMVAQDKSKWMVLRNVNPLGNYNEMDVQGDEFSPKAIDDLIEQGYSLPLLMDHSHEINDRPAVGMCIGAYKTSDGLREVLAVPLEDYNSNIVKGLLNGTCRFISVGMLVSPTNKICKSCGKSIYSYLCNHNIGEIDEKGNKVSVVIKKVDRYLERSLVNVPARLHTTVKSLTNEDEPYGDVEYADPGYQKDGKKRYPIDTESHIRAAWSYIHQERNSSKYTSDQLDHIKSKIRAAWKRKIDPEGPTEEKSLNFNDDFKSSGTIPTVNTIEDSILKKPLQPIERDLTEDGLTTLDPGKNDADPSTYTNVEALKSEEEKAAHKEPDGDEGVGGEDADGDDDTKAMKEDEACKEKRLLEAIEGFISTKSLKDNDLVVKLLEVQETHKSELGELKALTVKQAEVITKQSEVIATQSENIEKLCKLQEECANTIKQAALISSAEVLEKVMEVVSANKALQANTSKKLDINSSDWFTQLFGPQ